MSSKGPKLPKIPLMEVIYNHCSPLANLLILLPLSGLSQGFTKVLLSLASL